MKPVNRARLASLQTKIKKHISQTLSQHTHLPNNVRLRFVSLKLSKNNAFQKLLANRNLILLINSLPPVPKFKPNVYPSVPKNAPRPKPK